MSVPRIVRQHIRKEIPSFVLLIILGLLVVIPMVFIIIAAFSTAVPRPGNPQIGSFTLENFAIFGTPQGIESLVNSLVIGGGAAIVSLGLGATLAFIAARTDAPWRKFIYTAGIAPMFLPAIVGALAWSLLGSPNAGYLNVLLRDLGLPGLVNVYSIGGLIFVLGLFYAPYSFMLTFSSFSMMNADLEESASVHGAKLGRMFRTVTLPLAFPALAGAAILTFALAMENFPVNAVLGNPANINTLPTYIYRLMVADGEPNIAAGIAIALTIALIIVTLIQQRIVNRKRFTTLTGKGNRPRQIPLRGLRWVATGFAMLYFLLSVVLPILALVIASMGGTLYLQSIADLFARPFTLSRMSEAIGGSDFQLSLINSVLIAILAALASTVLSFSTSYVRYRTKSRFGQLLEQIAMSPLAIPSVVLGIGILWTWLTLPFPVYGTIVILVIAVVAVTMPQSYRSVSASMLQLDPDLENSATMLGAGRLQAIRSITLPLMRTGIVSTLLLIMMLAMREMSASIFLYTSQTRILSILVFNSFENGSISYSAALGLVFILVIAVLAISAQVIGLREKKSQGVTA